MALSLSGNLIGDGGVEILAAALKENTTLQALHLEDNAIGSEGAGELVR